MERINEAFGDTVNWDLFPDISVSMKNGFKYHDSDLEVSAGIQPRQEIIGIPPDNPAGRQANRHSGGEKLSQAQDSRHYDS